jgi:hypothetical protein
MQLANAAALTGDRIEVENYYQHAEHYLRQINELAGAAGSIRPHPTGSQVEDIQGAA